MKNKVVIVSGYSQCGKTTAEKEIAYEGRHIHVLSSIEPVRNVAYRCFGWDPSDRTERGRELLSNIKQAMNRYNRGCDNRIIDNVKRICDVEGDASFFIDIREPDSMEEMRGRFREEGFECCSILIERPELMDQNECESLKGIYKGKENLYDYYVQTNDLDEVKRAMKLALEQETV